MISFMYYAHYPLSTQITVKFGENIYVDIKSARFIQNLEFEDLKVPGGLDLLDAVVDGLHPLPDLP